VWARFDDLVSGTAVRCPRPHTIVRASRRDEVVPLLHEVERATDAGDWAFGFVSYEAAGGLDAALQTAEPSPDGPPLAWFGLCGPPLAVTPVAAGPPGAALRWTPDWSDQQHRSAVEAVRARIAAGLTYQCNLTDRFRAGGVSDPEELYRHLAHAQGGRYNAYLDLGDLVIASASPELFFEWAGDLLRTRPMKGTATRGCTPADDGDRARALRTSAKERAENLMIVDLLRNDLSRVARTGSVDVPALFTLERYPTVWQLTSEVTARARDGVGLADVFRALFPCGSVTGAPKASTMRLIRDLETSPRGVYCGAVGLIAPPGRAVRARFAVAIRTAVVDRVSGTAVYGAGGGITWGSEAAAERAELFAKAAVLRQTPDGGATAAPAPAPPDPRSVPDADRRPPAAAASSPAPPGRVPRAPAPPDPAARRSPVRGRGSAGT
jgi:para-aminobenzoate synthetase/4-amino-4-deoxychorismate lyase